MNLFKKTENVKEKKSLVIYFSHIGENYMSDGIRNIDKGNTEVVAEMIKDMIDADIFKVESTSKYPFSYNECCNMAKKQLENDERPEIKTSLDNIDQYEIIYIGYPIWWNTLPMPMFTQLEKLDFEGKIVRPFCTHEGSKMGSSIRDIKQLCKGATILTGLEIQGSVVNSSKSKVEKWVK